MKSLLIIALISFGMLWMNTTCAQVNTTASKYYEWKGKKTVPHEGYVVLRSGKKMEGEISIKGTYSSPDQIILTSGGDEKKFPPQALNEFGLYVVDPVCDTDPELFKWNRSESMGDQIENSKWAQGYLVDGNGEKFKGDLKVKKKNGFIEEFQLKEMKTGEKLKFERNEIAHYGLLLTVEDMGKKSGKDYNNPSRNWHEGTIVLKNGKTLNGVVAMKQGSYIGRYEGALYAQNMNDYVEIYSDSEIEEAFQNIDGTEMRYVPHEGLLVDFADVKSKMESADDKNPSRQFQKGYIELKNGKKVSGEVALYGTGDRGEAGMMPCLFCGSQVNVKLSEEDYNSYPSSEIEVMIQTIEGEEVMHINDHDFLVPVDFDGEKLMLYRNPYPTSESALGNIAAQVAMEATDTLSKSAAARTAENNLKRGEDLGTTLENTQETYEAVSELGSGIAAMLGSATRKEWIILEKSNGRKTIFNKSSYDNEVEGMLLGCEKYWELDKKEQKEMQKFDNIEETVKFLDKCY